jgi:outer membrane protein OmpA-like peptidoglycan-associated protein
MNEEMGRQARGPMLSRRTFGGVVAGATLLGLRPALAQPAGPLMPHVGGQITTAFSNTFGADAESTVTFSAVNSEMLSLEYVSTRGLRVARNILANDRANARLYVMGYAEQMPLVIPGSTSLGISGEVLRELRDRGRTGLSLAYDARLSRIDGELQLVERSVRVPLIVEQQLVDVPAVRATGRFASGDRTGTGNFLFLDNQNNPLMIESFVRFSWEQQPRLERIIRVSAGASMKSAMEQALATLRKYDLYGLHFAFDKADLLPASARLIDDIAVTLRNNPSWTIRIAGHTDSMGDAAYNLRLSQQRAASVASELERMGISATRLTTAGFGETQPIGDNATLDGRATNRRVELTRTDR